MIGKIFPLRLIALAAEDWTEAWLRYAHFLPLSGEPVRLTKAETLVADLCGNLRRRVRPALTMVVVAMPHSFCRIGRWNAWS
jgi:hypothetical protein